MNLDNTSRDENIKSNGTDETEVVPQDKYKRTTRNGNLQTSGNDLSNSKNCTISDSTTEAAGGVSSDTMQPEPANGTTSDVQFTQTLPVQYLARECPALTTTDGMDGQFTESTKITGNTTEISLPTPKTGHTTLSPKPISPEESTKLQPKLVATMEGEEKANQVGEAEDSIKESPLHSETIRAPSTSFIEPGGRTVPSAESSWQVHDYPPYRNTEQFSLERRAEVEKCLPLLEITENVEESKKQLKKAASSCRESNKELVFPFLENQESSDTIRFSSAEVEVHPKEAAPTSEATDLCESLQKIPPVEQYTTDKTTASLTKEEVKEPPGTSATKEFRLFEVRTHHLLSLPSVENTTEITSQLPFADINFPEREADHESGNSVMKEEEQRNVIRKTESLEIILPEIAIESYGKPNRGNPAMKESEHSNKGSTSDDSSKSSSLGCRPSSVGTDRRFTILPRLSQLMEETIEISLVSTRRKHVEGIRGRQKPRGSIIYQRTTAKAVEERRRKIFEAALRHRPSERTLLLACPKYPYFEVARNESFDLRERIIQFPTTTAEYAETYVKLLPPLRQVEAARPHPIDGTFPPETEKRKKPKLVVFPPPYKPPAGAVSKRVLDLSVPRKNWREIRSREIEAIQNVYQVSKTALTAVASERIEILAKPKSSKVRKKPKNRTGERKLLRKPAIQSKLPSLGAKDQLIVGSKRSTVSESNHEERGVGVTAGVDQIDTKESTFSVPSEITFALTGKANSTGSEIHSKLSTITVCSEVSTGGQRRQSVMLASAIPEGGEGGSGRRRQSVLLDLQASVSSLNLETIAPTLKYAKLEKRKRRRKKKKDLKNLECTPPPPVIGGVVFQRRKSYSETRGYPFGSLTSELLDKYGAESEDSDDVKNESYTEKSKQSKKPQA